MSKLESYGSLLPIAVVAGLLSGSLFRQTPSPEPAKPASKPPEARSTEEVLSSPWLSELRPVMETMGDAMGLSLQRDAASRAIAATGTEFDQPQAAQVTKAIADLRDGLQGRLASGSTECGGADVSISSAAKTLNSYLLSEDAGSSSRKLRFTAAEATASQVEDWRSFVALTRKATTESPLYRVHFIVATVPDYVDSNAGWSADQSLAAIQSAMSRADYLLDRFRLIDWTRNDARAENPVANESRLHERQPGVLIFRHPDGDVIDLAVVLLALETPTSGVHRAALRNGIRFIRAWNRCGFRGNSVRAVLNVLGPTFSGSSLSMALTLGDATDNFAEGFSSLRVISGSATADDNVRIFHRFAPGTSFTAALPPTSETQQVMAAFLKQMNSSWESGKKTAILLEGNTTYGQGSTPDKGGPDVPFQYASYFSFPLHVSQLRSDAPSAASPAVSLLPTAVVPLSLRETTPPADQIPALRPQLTSSVVESTVDTILDTIRHERLTAVGIQATDERDVLFLAREVKRAAPDVQLFFLGAHALYLHQDYVPYLRGTLVASPYPLSLTTQSDFEESSYRRREPFQSMSAEGLFNATLLLMDRQDLLVDYCAPGTASGQACSPRVAISVIGEDGFWPLAGVRETHSLSYAQSATSNMRFTPSGLPPVPMQAWILATLLVVFVVAQIVMLVFVSLRLYQGEHARRFLEWPVLRVLAPPTSSRAAATNHRFSLLMCYLVVALLFAWMAAALVPFAPFGSSVPLARVISVIAGFSVLVPAILLIEMTHRIKGPARALPQAARQKSAWLLLPAIVLFGVGLGMFVVYLVGLLHPGSPDGDLNLTLARLVGGGIVSPAPVTLGLFAALYTGMFASMRRATLVGSGYTFLEERSPAFGLLSGRWAGVDAASHSASHRARLGDVLDMPAQNLPLSYVLGILLAVTVACFSLWGVSTIEGRWFAWFLRAASAAALMFGLLNLAQGLVIWNTSRSHLKWLALSPIEGAFKSVANLVPWDLSLAPPRLIELMPVARRADRIVHELRALSVATHGSRDLRGSDEPYHRRATDQERRLVEAKLAMRRGDLNGVGKRVDTVSKVRILEREIRQQQHAAFIQSTSWWQLWNVSDAIVEMLRRSAWQRVMPARHVEEPQRAGLPVLLSVSSLPDTHATEGVMTSSVRLPAVLEASAETGAGPDKAALDERASLFGHCEEFVALQFAFVLRDIVARTVAALFTAMLCLTFLTAAHLLYSFNGRSALLTVDLLAVAAAAVTSIWILVGMEREPVLSRLRNTTPGRLDINWAFVQRVAVYGVLPLLAVLASLFPEIGNSLFGWLEPLRKLSSF